MAMLQLLALQGLLATTTAGPSQLIIQNCELGELYFSSSGSCVATLINSGSAPIRVSQFVPQGFRGKVEPSEAEIAPHGQVSLNLRIDGAIGNGNFYHAFQFRSDEPGFNKRVASAHAFVLNIFDDTKPTIDFGDVDFLTKEMPHKELSLSTREVAEFRLTGVLEKPEWLNAEISPDHHSLNIGLRESAPWGRHEVPVKLAVAADKQKELWVFVRANVRGQVIPDTDPVDLGTHYIGQPSDHMIRFVDRTGRALRVSNVHLESIKGTTSVEPCARHRRDCQEVHVKLAKEQAFGGLSGKLLLDFPDYERGMSLAVRGLMLKKGMKPLPNDRGPVVADNESRSRPLESLTSGVTKAQEKFNLGQELSNTARKTAMTSAPPPAGSGPLLKWTVAQSTSIYGFQIFRSDAESGRYQLINQSPIRSTATDEESVFYQWRDTSAVRGATYWYMIGTIKNDGTKEMLTQPRKALAK